jgi:hypothetical protein
MDEIEKHMQSLRNMENWEAAENALFEIGPPAVKPLLKALAVEEELTCLILIDLLKRIYKEHPEAPETSGIIPEFLELLKDKRHNMRVEASDCLGEIGEPALPGLVRMLDEVKEEPGRLHGHLMFTLGKISDAATLPQFIEGAASSTPDVRFEAVVGILNVIEKHPENETLASAVPVLISALEDNHPNTRGNAIEALSKLKDHRAVAPLLVTFGDELQFVRDKVYLALWNMLIACKSPEQLGLVWESLQQSYEAQKKEANGSRLNHIETGFAKIKIVFADMNNRLAGAKDLLLDDKPKPPKGGKMFQSLRRGRNG